MSDEPPLAPSTESFGVALRAAMVARGMSFRALESRSLVPVGNLHDHVSGKRGVPGDELLARIAEGVGVEASYFREWRERRLTDALHDAPELQLELWRRAEDGSLSRCRLIDI